MGLRNLKLVNKLNYLIKHLLSQTRGELVKELVKIKLSSRSVSTWVRNLTLK